MQVTIAYARNGHRRVPSAGGHYVRHLGLTNLARDDVLINQSKSKISNNLETVPNQNLSIFAFHESNQFIAYLAFSLAHQYTVSSMIG